MFGKIYQQKGKNSIKYNHVGNWYFISFSYWDWYVDGTTRLECGFWKFLSHIIEGVKCQVAIHRYNMKDGAGQIGRSIWYKYFNEKK